VNNTNLPDPKPFRARLTAWFRRHGRDLPWRRDTSPYAVLVSEFMLQQTQVTTVIPYFERWMRRFPDFPTLAAAEEAEVLSLWQGLGYYSRARNLHRAAKLVVEKHGGELPDDVEAIAELPGVGRYTVGAIASFAFDRSVATVDGNIARVLARVIDLQVLADSREGQEILWRTAEALLPPRGGRLYTSALMELGALLCTPRSPQCLICPIRDFCTAEEPEKLPLKRARARTVELDEPCAWIVRRDAILLEQQTGSRWRGLWKLPCLDSAPADEPLHSAEYPFTNHRVTLRVFSAPPPRRLEANQAWIPFADLEALALTAPHRRAIRALLESGG
jgi:A/G-specific adenine glycosylase